MHCTIIQHGPVGRGVPVAPNHHSHPTPPVGRGVPPLILALVCCVALSAPAHSAAFTATLQPEVIAQGTAATLQLRFQDVSPSDGPHIPEVPGVRFSQVGRGSEMTMVGGRVTQSLVISYQVTASQIGTYTIPPITATVDGRRLATQPLTLTVAATDPDLARQAFLTLAFPKERYYVGESTAAEIHLYALTTASGSVVRLPTLTGDGALFGTNVSLGQTLRVATNNGIYQRLAWRVPVTFAKAGRLQYSAQDCQLRTERRIAPRSGSIFSLLPEVETRTLSLNSDPVVLQILPLPTDQVPDSFSGAVGRFTLEAQIGHTNVTVGDPLTLTIRIAGYGNLPAVRWSMPDSWSHLKGYEPTSHFESPDPLGLSGARVFEQVLIPESTALQAIPPLEFAFFDPVSESYRVASHPGFPLNILAASSTTARPRLAATGTIGPSLEPADIAHIKNRPGTLAVAAPPLLIRPWFLGLQLLPMLAWAGAWWLRRRRERLALNPRQHRRIQAGHRLRHGLNRLRNHAVARRSDAFHQELYELLQEQLGERLDLPASGISAEIVEQHLRRVIADPSLTEAIAQLFHHCDHARYAPDSATGDLETLRTLAENTLRRIRDLSISHAP